MAITAVAARDFAAVVILGGRAPEYLRNDASLLSLVREFAEQEKCICAIGHGVQILTAAGLRSAGRVTCHPHVRIEVERSGGICGQQAGGARPQTDHRAELEVPPGVLPRNLRLPGRL